VCLSEYRTGCIINGQPDFLKGSYQHGSKRKQQAETHYDQKSSKLGKVVVGNATNFINSLQPSN